MTTREPMSAGTPPTGDVTVPQQRTRSAHEAPAREGAVREPGSAPTGRDRVRWGPIWAGALVTVTTFLVLQLLVVAFGWLDIGPAAMGSTAASVISGVLGLIAFFVGGLTAGASSMWRSASDGALNGVLVWALSVVGILGLALLGRSALFGPMAAMVVQAPDGGMSTVRESAGWTALGLGLAVAAAVLGGMVGSKMWPGRGPTGAR